MKSFAQVHRANIKQEPGFAMAQELIRFAVQWIDSSLAGELLQQQMKSTGSNEPAPIMRVVKLLFTPGAK
jgi:hypothetical protein